MSHASRLSMDKCVFCLHLSKQVILRMFEHLLHFKPKERLELNGGATAILKLELRKSALLFAKTKVMFEISVSFPTRYKKTV